MKKKIISVLLVLTMVLTLGLVTAVPAAANGGGEPDAVVFPFELGGKSADNYVAEWVDEPPSCLVSSAVHLATTGEVGTGDEARIKIDLSDLPEGEVVTLGDLFSIAWREYLVAGYPPHLDVSLDVNGNGEWDGYPEDDILVFEYAYNSEAHADETWPTYGALTEGCHWTFNDDGLGPDKIDDTANAWAGSGPPGPLHDPSFIYYTLAEWKAGVTYTTDAEKTINSDTQILYLEIEVDNWIVQTEAYVDDIVINDMPFYGLIQDAIDSVDSSTIFVMPGTYDGTTETFPIIIDKSLTLMGAQYGVDPTAEGARADESEESVIDAGTTDASVIEISADSVTVDGFTLKTGDIASAWPVPNGFGVAIQNQSGCHIENNIVNNRVEYGGGGVYFEGVTSSTIKNNLIMNTGVFTTWGGETLVNLCGSSNNNTIEGNTIKDSDWHGIALYDTSSENLVKTNTVKNCMNVGITIDSSHNTIDGNTCDTNDDGGIELWDAGPGNTITGNTVKGHRQSLSGDDDSDRGFGISVYQSSNTTITGNTVTDNKLGINLEGECSNVTITGNTFQENDIQVLDAPEALVIEDVLAPNNTFDRAVTVDHDGASLLHTIWSSIQDGIDAALAGDTVLVYPGTYDLTAPIAVDEAVTLIGDTATPDNVMVNAGTISGDDRDCFQVMHDDVTIQGFKMINAITGTLWEPGCLNGGIMVGNWGDGMWATNHDVAEISGFDFSHNSFDNCSYGIYFFSCSDAVISYNTFTNINITSPDWPYDGLPVVLITTGYAPPGDPHDMDEIDNVTISHNTISTGREGIGIGVENYQGGQTGTISNITVEDNEISGATGCGISLGGWRYSDVVLPPTFTNINISHNSIHGNGWGLHVWGGKGDGLDGFSLDGVHVNFNNIYDNNLSGTNQGFRVVGDENMGTVDATMNWWGDISGPKQATTNPRGEGDEVSDNVDYQPWLTREFAIVQADNIAYFGYAWVNLSAGWNIVSTPIALDPDADTWGEYVALGAPDLHTHATNPAYSFNAQTGIFELLTGSYQLKPCDAIYVRMAQADIAPILYSPNVSVPSKDVYSGWNLVGLANLDEMSVADALISIETVPGCPFCIGYSLVVSPPMNQTPWSCPPEDWDNTEMKPTKGYWVFMINDGTLAGFTFTPQSLP